MRKHVRYPRYVPCIIIMNIENLKKRKRRRKKHAIAFMRSSGIDSRGVPFRILNSVKMLEQKKQENPKSYIFVFVIYSIVKSLYGTMRQKAHKRRKKKKERKRV